MWYWQNKSAVPSLLTSLASMLSQGFLNAKFIIVCKYCDCYVCSNYSLIFWDVLFNVTILFVNFIYLFNNNEQRMVLSRNTVHYKVEFLS